MDLFATCPGCQLSLRLLPPKPSNEIDSRLLMNVTDIFPLKFNEQARWLCVCPECKSEFVPLSYLSEHNKADEARVYAMLSLSAYRKLREHSLRDTTYAHLGRMLEQGSIVSWVLTCIAGIVWGLWSHRFAFLFISCGSVFAWLLLLPVLESGGERARLLHKLVSSCGAFFGAVGWLVVASFLGKVELLMALVVFVLCWAIALKGVVTRLTGDSLIAVEQELLQLRRLTVTPRYWVNATSPYR